MRYRFPPTLADLPMLMQLGLLVLVCGGALDMLYHAGLAPWLGAYLGRDGMVAHLVILCGMVVAMLGLFVGRRPRRSAPAATGEGGRQAESKS